MTLAPLTDAPDVIALGRRASGLDTGIPSLDALGGLPPGRVTAICAPRSLGASSLALSFALRAARDGVPVAYFALDTGRTVVMERLLAFASGVSPLTIRHGPISAGIRAKLEEHARELGRLPLWLEARPARDLPPVDEACALLPEMPRLIVVDPLDATSVDEDGSRALADRVAALGLALLVTTTMPPLKDASEEPRLADVPGAVASVAALILAPHRPAYYDADSSLDEAWLHVLWNDAGPKGAIPLRWRASVSRFVDDRT